MTRAPILEIPTLETERLILRGFGPQDVEPFVSFYATEDSRFVGGPCERALAWRRFASYAGGWLLRGYGKYALEEKASGNFVGLVGPWYPEGWPEPEIAWTVIPEFQGRGFAKEAAIRALRHVYEDLGWKRAVSCVNAENKPSIRLAESLGATLEGETEIRPYGPALLYRHQSPAEFLAYSSSNKLRGVA